MEESTYKPEIRIGGKMCCFLGTPYLCGGLSVRAIRDISYYNRNIDISNHCKWNFVFYKDCKING